MFKTLQSLALVAESSMTPSQTSGFQWPCWLQCFIALLSRHAGFNDTAVSDSVSMTLLSQTPKFPWHCWARHRGFTDTAKPHSRASMTLQKSDSRVSMTRLSQNKSFQWDCWVRLQDFITTAESDIKVFHDIAESDTRVSITLLCRVSVTLLSQTSPGFSWHCWVRPQGFNNTAESDPSVSHDAAEETPEFQCTAESNASVPITLMS
jgi:hypothetical protein